MAEEQQDIKAIKEEATKEAEQIRTSLESVKSYVTELETVKEEVRSKRLAVTQISTNAQTKDTEIQTIHTNIVALETKAKELVGKIETENTKLATNLRAFEITKAKLVIDAEGIAGHKKEVEGYRKEVEKIYGYINGQGLAHSFSERQKQLKWPLIIWSIMLFASTCLVSWALYEVFRELPIDTMTGKRIFEPSSLFYRLSFVSPIILIFFVSLRQYSRERRLLESYAFKAATAKALES